MNPHEFDSRFSEELGKTPPVPAGAYAAVEQEIHRVQHRVVAGWMAAAAGLLLAAGIAFYAGRGDRPGLSEDDRALVEEELQSVAAYFGGSDITEELSAYAIDISTLTPNGGGSYENASY
jgi:hypothetical protein